jgi:hypothetical protein
MIKDEEARAPFESQRPEFFMLSEYCTHWVQAFLPFFGSSPYDLMVVTIISCIPSKQPAEKHLLDLRKVIYTMPLEWSNAF